MIERRELTHRILRKIPLFWKVLVLVLVVTLIPLGLAISTSLTAAITTAESLVSKNILQLADRVAERLSYTFVSIEGDLDVLKDVPLSGEDYRAFALAQRRELYGSGEERTRFAAPKYLEVGFYAVDGSPKIIIYKDEVVAGPGADWNGKTWCDESSFAASAAANPSTVLVTGLVGCPLTDRTYSPGNGLLGERFDGGVRVSEAVLNPDGSVRGVVSLVLAELHLTWALLSLEERSGDEGLWALVVDHEGGVISHPDPSRIFTGGENAAHGKSWSDPGPMFLPSMVESPESPLGILLAETGAGNATTHQLSTGPDDNWMVAAQPISVDFGGYSATKPFASVWVFYPRSGVIAEWLRLSFQYALLLAVTLIVALIGSVILARNLSKPIQRLSAAARRIAKGDEPEIPALDRADEVGDLARSFQQMQMDIRVHQEAVMRSERLAAVGTFVAGIVHETKNVLAGLGNYLTLLDRRLGDDPIRGDVIEPMRRALDQLDTLTLRMRELALTPRFATTELTEVLRHSLELVEHQAREEHIEIAFQFEKPIYLTKADGSLLGQVFLNLILNAVQASPRDGRIQIDLAYDGTDASVRIHDSGEGFPEDKIEEVFQPFMTTKTGGTGLGLYISRSIILRHGGDLKVSNHPSGGAVVEVHFFYATDVPTSYTQA